ncbi:MAG: LPD29 domain-containing protein [Blautia caecimuris]
MAKYFKNIKSFDDLKKQFKDLLKKHHPDNGGDAEIMKAVNVEYDSLFLIWKNRKEAETGSPINETADSTRSEFYTENGWKGANHNWNRTLKEVAQIVRTYVKEKYPTYKFSVRTEYASMCQKLHVTLKESPIPIYKDFEELTSEDIRKIAKGMFPWDYLLEDRLHFLNTSKEDQKKIIEESTSRNRYILNEVTQAVIEDVDSFVKSYNYEDCDGMIDYCHVDFFYFGCCQDNGENIKIIPKTARIKNRSDKPVKQETKTNKEAQSENKNSVHDIEENKTDKKETYTYDIKEGEDTRDGSKVWIVRIKEKLDKSAYISENRAMKKRGGYYSRFRHGFIFRFDPTEVLKTA